MRRLRYILTISTLTILLTSYIPSDEPNKLFEIPSQTINLYKLLDESSNGIEQSIQGFNISKLVTYKEYKEYLSDIKKDSTKTYFLTQLPDSNIGSIDVRNEYISNSEYDNFPVLGISWDNAMNFCKWKTLKEKKDSIQFIYRLPNCSEWLAAYFYLSEKDIKNDFNNNYSDWLLNSKDESFYVFNKSMIEETFPFDYIHFHKTSDPLALKRKFVIGDSYLFQQDKLLNYYSLSYYSTEGYRQVSFRYIKEPINKSENIQTKRKSIAENILEYWGIK